MRPTLPLSLVKLAWRNAFRHRLRTVLTTLGLAVAVMAYGLLSTVIEAWYANANASSDARLITHSAISLSYPLPLTYADALRRTPGVARVTWLSWFGGRYRDNRIPFARLAVDGDSYFDVYPEYKLDAAQRQAFAADRQGAVIGPKLAATLGLHVGDTLPIQGDRYPGTWRFTVRAIYQPVNAQTDDALMFVHWQLLADTLRARLGGALPDAVGAYVLQAADPGQVAAIAEQVDARFRDSSAATRTETERAYQLGIVAMSRHVIDALHALSIGLALITLAVLANTMAMSAGERLREYATLQALGFRPGHVARLLLTESLSIALLAAGLGITLTFPASGLFVDAVGSLVEGYVVSPATLGTQLGAALSVGVLAAVWPAWRAARMGVSQGLGATT